MSGPGEGAAGEGEAGEAGEAGEGEERVRLFVALELPEQAREAIMRWRGRATAGLDGLRAIPREYLHATMCFLGWRRLGEVAAIADACGVLAVQPAPELRLAEAIWLPPRRPQVLAVSLSDPTAALARAQSALSGVLAAGGWYELEHRAYLAHVTAARAGRRVRVPPTPLTAPEPLSFRASTVTLYRSRLTRAGARYEPLSSVELAAG